MRFSGGPTSRKNHFRLNPERPVWGRSPQYIRTAQGPRLLTSGWWGLSRHMSYFGDLMIALSWCLPAVFGSPLPYFYMLPFTLLLIHRERRDDAMCLAKYGEDWRRYRTQVPWRIVPGLY